MEHSDVAVVRRRRIRKITYIGVENVYYLDEV
jgi:hypothetical protein